MMQSQLQQYGLVLHQDDCEFFPVGTGFLSAFRSTKPDSTLTGILSVVEKEMTEGGILTTL